MTAIRERISPQRSRPAQAELTALAEQFCGVLKLLNREVGGSKPQTAGAVARRYLDVTEANQHVNQVYRASTRLLIEDERQRRLFDGSLFRARSALRYLDEKTGDPFARAQVLVQALTDLVARLAERGLLLPEISAEAEYDFQPVQEPTQVSGHEPSFDCAA